MKLGLILLIAAIAALGQCASLQHKPKHRTHARHSTVHRAKTPEPTPLPKEEMARLDRFYFGSPMAIQSPIQVADPATEKKPTVTPTPPKPPRERPREPF